MNRMTVTAKETKGKYKVSLFLLDCLLADVGISAS